MATGTPSSTGVPALPLETQRVCILENGKDLLLVRNRLATQKTPLHLVNLPPGVSDEA